MVSKQFRERALIKQSPDAIALRCVIYLRTLPHAFARALANSLGDHNARAHLNECVCVYYKYTPERKWPGAPGHTHTHTMQNIL